MNAYLRFVDVVALLDSVHDPCSDALGRPMGLVEMGLVRKVAVEGRRIEITLSLTEPSCIYSFQIAESVEAAAHTAFGSDVAVEVAFSDELLPHVWTEADMTATARGRVAVQRGRDASTQQAKARQTTGPSQSSSARKF